MYYQEASPFKGAGMVGESKNLLSSRALQSITISTP